MTSFNVCVVGYGLSATTFHIPFVLATAGLELHSIVQRAPKTSAQEAHPSVTIYRAIEEALDDAAVNIVIITSPNSDHHQHALQALGSRKHVVVEKPVTTDWASARQLSEAARASGRTLSVFHNRRWDSDFLTLQRLLRRGELGAVVAVESRYDRFKPVPAAPADGRAWKLLQTPGNGTLWDLGSHLIDQALAQWGVPQRVWGLVRDERQLCTSATFGTDGWAEDAFEAVLYYPPESRLIVKLGASTLALRPAGKQLRWHVRGTDASWTKCGMDVQEDQVKAGLAPGSTGFGAEPTENWGVLSSPLGDTLTEPATGDYGAFYRNLVGALEGREELAVKPEDAAQVIRIIELIGKSSNEGRVLDLD